MTKLSILTNKEKRSNEGSHIIHYDQDFHLKLGNPIFETRNDRGRSFNVKFVTFDNGTKEKKTVVLKWLSQEHPCTPKYHFKWTKKRSVKASRVIAAFNDSYDTAGWKFIVIKPTVVKYQDKVVSIEPYIKHMTCFQEYVNSEACILSIVNLLKALCRFSYRFSKGKFVMDNLKIGVDQDKRQVFMLPPSLVSRETETYGCEDNGKLCDIVNHGCKKF